MHMVQVRAKHMTLDPEANRYVKYIRNIRTIQVKYTPVLSIQRSKQLMYHMWVMHLCRQ